MPRPKKIHPSSHRHLSAKSGFTIVELAIVIVVLAILSVIAFLAYGGVQARAGVAVIKSDLKQAHTHLALIEKNDGSYPNSANVLPISEGTKYEYTKANDKYCLTASSKRAKASSHITSDKSGLQEGPCAGHQGYVSGS